MSSDASADTGKAAGGLGKKFFSGVFYVTGQNYILQVITFIGSILMARILDPVHFGILALATFFFSLFSRVSILGFNYILIQKPHVTRKDLSTHFFLQVGSTFFSILITLGLAPILRHWYERDVVLVAIALALSSILDREALLSTPATLLEKEFHYKELSIIQVISTIASYIFGIWSALSGWGVWSLVALAISEKLVYFIGIWVITPWRPSFVFDWKSARWFIRNAFHLWLGGGVIMFFVIMINDFLLGTFKGTTELGYYSKGMKSAQWPYVFTASVLQVAFPTYSKLQKNRERLSEFYGLILRFLARVAFPFSALLALVAPEIVEVLYTKKWLPMAPLLQFFLLYSFFRPILDTSGGVLMATGKYPAYLRGWLFQGAAALVILPLGVYLWGADGASAGLGVVICAGVASNHVFIGLDIPFFSIFFNPLISIAAGAGAMLLLSHSMTVEGTLPRLLLHMAAFGLSYSLVLFSLEGKELIKLTKMFVQVARGKH